MAETVDWKKKHLDSLREMEVEERRWREAEQILRRLVTRLCAVALGVDPRLDAQLLKLSAASRKAADTLELKALCDSLTDAVMAIEKSGNAAPPAADPDRPPTVAIPAAARGADTAAAPPAGGLGHLVTQRLTRAAPAPPALWKATAAAAAALIDRLAPADPSHESLATLRADVVAAGDDRTLAAVLARVADVVAERAAELARERSEAAAMLAQVTDRLEEMALYLASANNFRQQDHAAAESLNIEVLAHVSRLSDEVRASDDLTTLRGLVADRLEAVAANVREFCAREEHRYVEHTARDERMRARIIELERETRDLGRNLDLEKRRARQDPLTRLANRASFDERFAEEIVRWQRFRAPVAVLLWDVDNFKAINDAYGHRTGDAALREVANCLGRGRRAVDFLARYGGEEFVTLLVGSPFPEAVRIADEMRAAVASLKFHFRGTPVRITVSCGLTELREGDTAESVFDRADKALYRAKDGGRNVCIAA